MTGQLPFNAQNVNDLLFKIVLESPRPLREAAPDVDPAFAQIIEIAMARDPENRFQSASAFIGALDSWGAEHGVVSSLRASSASAPMGGVVAVQSAHVKVPSGATRSLLPTPGTWADSKVSVAAFQPRPRRIGVNGKRGNPIEQRELVIVEVFIRVRLGSPYAHGNISTLCQRAQP